MKETAIIENILITACIPQNDTTVTPYFIMAFTGKRKTMPAGIIKIPRVASRKDNLWILNFSAQIPAVKLPKIAATAADRHRKTNFIILQAYKYQDIPVLSAYIAHTSYCHFVSRVLNASSRNIDSLCHYFPAPASV